MPILSLIVDESKQYEHLIAWYEANARDLPWRAPGTTAWGVLLSEVMSHQTQVDRVAPIWQEWIARWPTPVSYTHLTLPTKA